MSRLSLALSVSACVTLTGCATDISPTAPLGTETSAADARVGTDPIPARVAAVAAGTSFTATADGNWDDPATWGGAGPPLAVGPDDVVLIPSGRAVSINVGLTVNLGGSLTILGSLDVNPAGELVMSSSGSIDNLGTLDINPRGIVRSLGGSFHNQANLVLRFSAAAGLPASGWFIVSSGEFVNHASGYIELGGLLSAATDLVNEGTVDVLRSTYRRGVIALSGSGAFHNYGTVRIEDTARMNSSSAVFYNHPGAGVTITDVGDFIVGPGLLINDSGIENGGELFNDEGGAIHQLCGGTITGNAVIGDAPLDQCDTTPPGVTATVTGTLGDNGWYTSNVLIEWTVTDPESVILSEVGCGTTNLVSDTPGTTYTCEATSNGGTTTESVTVKRDATAPLVTATVSPEANANGWHNATVEVVFTGTDGTSGIAVCDPPETLASEGAAQSATGTCTDAAGNVGGTTAQNINIDTTVPVVGFSGNAGTYQVSDAVAITCSATDALSGIDTSVCPTATGPAHTFDLTTPTVLQASATDLAGNTATAMASFSVVVDLSGVLQLVDDFLDKRSHARATRNLIEKILGESGDKRDKSYETLATYLDTRVGSDDLAAAEADVLLGLVGVLCGCGA